MAGAAPKSTKMAKVKQTDSVERGRGSVVRETPKSGMSTTSADNVSAQKPPRAAVVAKWIALGSSHTTMAAAIAMTHQTTTFRSCVRSPDTIHHSEDARAFLFG